jgi:hypothetical protein
VRKSVGAGHRAVDRLLETGGTVTEDLRVVRFAGISLAGGKTDKTAVAIIEYYPERARVFLRSLHDKVSSKGEVTADEALVQILREEERSSLGLSALAFDAPLQIPVCMRCKLKCPGVVQCEVPAVEWMRDVHRRRKGDKRPNKMFTPYTERAAEIVISHELEEPFHPPHALGANAAPLTARAHFIGRQLVSQRVEVYPKLSLWRIGNALGVPKSHLRFHKHAVDSDEARQAILTMLLSRDIAFIYHQDLKIMVENNHAFEAFLCALTAFLRHRKQTESAPDGFPEGESWIDFPTKNIRWFP